MSTIRWLAEKTVKHCVEKLMVHIRKPAGYDEAVAYLNRHNENISFKSLTDHIALRKARERVETVALLKAIASAAGVKDESKLISDVASAAERLAAQSRKMFVYVKKSNFLNYSTQDALLFKDDLEAFRAAETHIANEWLVTIKYLLDQKRRNVKETQLHYEVIAETAVKHETSILSARNIVTDCFRVSKEFGNGDHCVNFNAEQEHDDQAERKGCVLHFSWSGPVVTSETKPTSMDIDTLYEYDRWRYALAPGTTKHLTLIEATFDKDPIPEENGLALSQILNARGNLISVRVGSTCDYSSWHSLRSSSPSLQRRQSSTGSMSIFGLLRRLYPRRGRTT